eukprot:2087282-Pyramimonas_sp.AAC.1
MHLLGASLGQQPLVRQCQEIEVRGHLAGYSQGLLGGRRQALCFQSFGRLDPFSGSHWRLDGGPFYRVQSSVAETSQ